MNLWLEFKKGIIDENPVYRLALGLCPVLAVTTSALNGIAMGLATLFVLLSANIMVSMLRNVIPGNVRIPSYIIVIATFVSIVDFTMNAYLPDIHSTLGIFIPLIVVNCLILGRAEVFAGRNKIVPAISDALGMGLGFTLALFSIAAVREIFGAGTLFAGTPLGFNIMGPTYQPATLMVLAPGGFITIGVLMGLFNAYDARSKAKQKSAAKAAILARDTSTGVEEGAR